MPNTPCKRTALLLAGVVWMNGPAFPCAWGAEQPKAAVPIPANHAKDMAAGLELFKNGVRSALREHCVACHGGEKVRNDFDLTTREGLLKGGADGVAVIAGNSRASRLLKLIRHEEEPFMPNQKPKLPEAAIAQIAAWIDTGAPYDQPLIENAREVKDRSGVSEQDRQFWSFQPLETPEPPEVRNRSWCRTQVDRFIVAKLEAKGIQANPPLDRRKLIRRAYFDLIGLPPTPQDIEAFLKDTSSQAYEHLVDRLLANPHYGERWGRHWLDLARFGESHGYEQDYDRPFAYPYRDFVIRALNDDLPYRRFVRWQIAGDELEPDNPQAWLATGFLGAGTHATQITANQAEKERYDELDDTVSTIGTAMLGLTIGCARCHDHKFDPIPTRDYYGMLATFTRTVRSDYDIDLDPVRTRRLEAEFKSAHQPLVAALRKFEHEQLPGRFAAWLATKPSLPQPGWLGLELEQFRLSGGYYGINKSTRQDDGSWLVNITAGSPDTCSFSAQTTLTNLTAIRLEALTDRTLPNYGPGWSKDGAFAMSSFSVVAKPLKGGGQPVSLKLARRRSPAGGDDPSKPWTSGTKPGQGHIAVYELDKPAGFAAGTELAFTLKFSTELDRNIIGRLRVSLGTASGADLDGRAVAVRDFELAQAALPTLGNEQFQPAAGEVANKRGPVLESSQSVENEPSGGSEGVKKVAIPASKKPSLPSPQQKREAVMRIYRTIDPEWRKLAEAVAEHAKCEPHPRLVKAMVCSEGLPAIRLHTQGPDYYEKTYYLKRGDLAQKQAEATPCFLQILMRASEREKHWQTPPPTGSRTPGQRAALAAWITDVDHGAGNLLARVIVNRLWQHHLGRGIVATPSDFGYTGARPTHPELLDWLAGELIRSGWQLKPIHKLIMTSAVYLQGNDTDESRLSADAENSLWWHRSPMRLEAEPLRDTILAVSGRLDPTMFGPGSLDEGMLRRSIYFTIKRSQLIPMMVQFDAPDSLQGVGLRVPTTVAPQALLLMNNPHVREAAASFAERLKLAAEKSLGAAVESAYLTALGRLPSRSELKDSLVFLEQQTVSYRKPEALRLALADFCQAIFGLNEFIYVE